MTKLIEAIPHLITSLCVRNMMKVKDLPSVIKNENYWRSKDCCYVVPKKNKISILKYYQWENC
jgi:hypothetical protein